MSSRTSARTCLVVVGFASLSFAFPLTWAADDKPTTKEVPKRKPWTTSKITGSPEPPPKYRSAPAFGDLKFHHPDLIARCPGSDRLFVAEQEGVLYSVKPGAGAKKDVFLDLRKDYKKLKPNAGAAGLGELYGLVFHPKFAENRYCYVCYTLNSKSGKLDDGTRVSRFQVTKTDPPRIDPATEDIVITFLGGGHNGGDLHFGPDGMLYISTGDGSSPNPPDALTTGQDCSDLLSSILRIDVDHRDAGKNHAIPKDNPFVGMKDVRPEIWAFGFRNPWRMSFDRKTGDLYVGDVGWELWEMVHKITKGGNYGWSIMEARQPIRPNQKIGPTPIQAPLIEISHTVGTSVTGGYVYRGKKFPELDGAYIFGDWETRRIWAARFADGWLKEMPEIVKPNIRVSAFGEDNAGEIYYAEYDSGVIYTLERNDGAAANTKFPTKLSETGLFQDVKKHAMAEGVRAFSPNAHQWQDGATAEHFIALPGLSSVKVFDQPRPLPGQVFWHNFKMQFPPDAVLVKTISLDVLINGKPTRRRLETQILHCDGEDWRGYTYRWRDDQSDADLVPADGDEQVVEVPDARFAAGKREQLWTFHSRSQCMSCHNSWSEYALAFSVGQLNFSSGESEIPNPLIALNREGYIQRVGKDDNPMPSFDDTAARKELALPRDHNRGAREYTAEERARSYLHVNCAHCHRFGGGGGQVVLELDYSKPMKETGILDVKPKQGDFGIPDASIVKTGEPDRSVLLYRMAKFGKGRMPHLGSEMPDQDGIITVRGWIWSLNRPNDPIPGISVGHGSLHDVDPPLKSPQAALPVATTLSIRGGSAPSLERLLSFNMKDRERFLAAAAKLEPGP
ncbi:MAG TPA: PQQ-dependent sugar dehydrogenase, partial [Gemmata sp.]|nr:PQQ-dependent sugar dehydrogenase [Gemmata sp.]